MSKFSCNFQAEIQSVKIFEQDLMRDRMEYIIDVLDIPRKVLMMYTEIFTEEIY